MSMHKVIQLLISLSVYQEYLAKTLTDKYSNLNQQMDKVLNDANSELNILNQRISSTPINPPERLQLMSKQICKSTKTGSSKRIRSS